MAKRKKPQPVGAPAWMATFADMATLLMSFFVLLLAFSEMDVVKYKAVSGSMKKALGVKTDSFEVTLPEGPPSEQADLRGVEEPKEQKEVGTVEVEHDLEKLSPEALLIRQRFAEELEDKRLEIEVLPDRIIIRLPEQGVFPSGSAALDDSFLPILGKIRGELAEIPGSIVVAGHTDDVPIATARFRSNWDLSAARASSVVHVLLSPEADDEYIDPRRVVAQGYADTRPLVPNEDAESRARNRRVDIILAPPRLRAQPE
ncbi:MAG: OmpA family protein [Deltaproteobacteria bacterium]|nr:OmpA family protein [Deltaproteobacteria bacterium]MCB9787800.1 OmpA family protein [Deltaproteobacteria bacterium]